MEDSMLRMDCHEVIVYEHLRAPHNRILYGTMKSDMEREIGYIERKALLW